MAASATGDVGKSTWQVPKCHQPGRLEMVNACQGKGADWRSCKMLGVSNYLLSIGNKSLTNR